MARLFYIVLGPEVTKVRHNFMLTSRTRELSRGRKCYRLKGIDYMTEDVSKLHGKYVQLGEVKLQ